MRDTIFAIFSGNPQGNQFGAGHKKSKSDEVELRIGFGTPGKKLEDVPFLVYNESKLDDSSHLQWIKVRMDI